MARREGPARRPGRDGPPRPHALRTVALAPDSGRTHGRRRGVASRSRQRTVHQRRRRDAPRRRPFRPRPQSGARVRRSLGAAASVERGRHPPLRPRDRHARPAGPARAAPHRRPAARNDRLGADERRHQLRPPRRSGPAGGSRRCERLRVREGVARLAQSGRRRGRRATGSRGGRAAHRGPGRRRRRLDSGVGHRPHQAARAVQPRVRGAARDGPRPQRDGAGCGAP